MKREEATNILVNHTLFLQNSWKPKPDEKVLKAIEVAITAMKELTMYKDGGLVLIPTDVFKNQCDRLDELEPLQNPLEVDEIIRYNGKIGYLCKNCGAEVAVNQFNGNFCNWCGQKLKWGNEDAE